MTYKELLELAAKAAGWAAWDWLAGDGALNVYDAEGRHAVFTPLTDDGEALRLAVTLQMSIVFGANYVIVNGSVQEPTVNNTNDPHAATRYAIVRAAAEIGKAMGQPQTRGE